jgi:PAS domain S-box-containing protein
MTPPGSADDFFLFNLFNLSFETLFNEVPCYISLQDKELRIIGANRRFKEKFGDDVTGEPCYSVYKNLDAKCETCPVEETFRDGKSRQSEQLATRRDGQQVPILIKTTPIRNDDGEIIAVMEMSTDISEVKRLQHELDMSRQLYQALFEEVPCYIAVIDRDFKLVQGNRRFREDFGGPTDGERCYQLYKHRKEPCLVCPVAATFQDGQMHTSEEVVTALSGERMNVLCYTAPIHDAEGNIQYVIEMNTNITEIRQLQDQLTSLGLLVGSISHGIKGLLTGLDGGVYIMNTGFKRDDMGRIKKGWGMIQRNVDRIRSMVLDVLYYAKEREPEWTLIPTKELLTEICKLFEKKCRDIDVALVTDFDRELGDIEADTKAIRSCLVNLIENSVDACRMDKSKTDHRVRVSAWREEKFMRFEIEDNGIGMDRETRENIFSLFFSSKGTSGTGLGLFIANKIVNNHLGNIEVASEPKIGTKFTVRFPVKRLEKKGK